MHGTTKSTILPETKHFRIEQLADGVFAAINRQDGWAIGNAGIIDMGDYTIVFDTTLTPASAEELRLSAEYLTGHSTSYVINSHYHNDHTWGNMQFMPSSLIISSTITRQLMQDKGKEEFRYYKANASKQKAKLQVLYDRCQDEESRSALRSWFTYHLALQKNMRKIRRILPNLTFREHLCLCGERRFAELIVYENGHTSSDMILRIPDEGIIFMADLLCVEFHPYLEECDPFSLIGIIKEIEQLGAMTFVPGHGSLGSFKDLACMEEYVLHLEHLASGLQCAGTTEEAVESVDIPEQFINWDFGQLFHSNLKSMWQLLAINN